MDSDPDSYFLPTRDDLVRVDLDLRLFSLWVDAWGVDDWDEGTRAFFLRSAYAQGYLDALAEDEKDRGQLCRDHGFSVPERGSK